jgi:ketosteroid isomerase-like protein
MKIRLVVALVGLAISFALPTFAQQTNTPDPQLREAIVALHKKYDDAFDNGDASALAVLYTEDAVEVTDSGLIYGREAIEKHYADVFQKVHFSNHVAKTDQNFPYIIGTAGNEMWAAGEWSTTIQGQNFGPLEAKGYWAAVFGREGDAWKKRWLTWNVTPAPASAPTK